MHLQVLKAGNSWSECGETIMVASAMCPGPHLNFRPYQCQPSSRGLGQAGAPLLGSPSLFCSLIHSSRESDPSWLVSPNLLFPPALSSKIWWQNWRRVKPCKVDGQFLSVFQMSLPCMELFIPEGPQMFQSQATMCCLALKLWLRLRGYMCDCRCRSMA